MTSVLGKLGDLHRINDKRLIGPFASASRSGACLLVDLAPVKCPLLIVVGQRWDRVRRRWLPNVVLQKKPFS